MQGSKALHAGLEAMRQPQLPVIQQTVTCLPALLCLQDSACVTSSGHDACVHEWLQHIGQIRGHMQPISHGVTANCVTIGV